jgi:hypothetical protein
MGYSQKRHVKRFLQMAFPENYDHQLKDKEIK